MRATVHKKPEESEQADSIELTRWVRAIFHKQSHTLRDTITDHGVTRSSDTDEAMLSLRLVSYHKSTALPSDKSIIPG